MKRTRYTKLLALARWADHYRPGGRPLAATERSAALTHGMAAVRAVRSIPPCTPNCNEHDPRTNGIGVAVAEARLAVRAALRAVGLKTL